MDNTLIKTVNTAWQKSKWIVKGFIIGILALVLMIPMMYVKELVLEREQRQAEATNEIAGKWAGRQNITGPVIGIPFYDNVQDSTLKNKGTKHVAYFLPTQLSVKAIVNPREKHRGIFKVMLYDTRVQLSGNFSDLDPSKLKLRPEQLLWNEAFVLINIAEVKGLNEQLSVQWNDSTIDLLPDQGDGREGMTASLKLHSMEDLKNSSFHSVVDLNGSQQLSFTPVGKSTSVSVESSWKDPSFSGSMLPQETTVNDSGFKAQWKSLAHKRNFPQQWVDDNFIVDQRIPAETNTVSTVAASSSSVVPAINNIRSSAFGVDLYIPVNGYQKTLRTIKYALLCILLTFAAFFLIETANKKSAHPFQYGLIGLALILFYTLLLSISEYTGFNTAYLIASIATVSLIAWFVKSILESSRATIILSFILVLIYSYIFSLLQLQDYSLLLGSVGLFISLSVVMYFSKKMQW